MSLVSRKVCGGVHLSMRTSGSLATFGLHHGLRHIFLDLIPSWVVGYWGVWNHYHLGPLATSKPLCLACLLLWNCIYTTYCCEMFCRWSGCCAHTFLGPGGTGLGCCWGGGGRVGVLRCTSSSSGETSIVFKQMCWLCWVYSGSAILSLPSRGRFLERLIVSWLTSLTWL